MRMTDRDLGVLIHAHPASTLVGELARDLFATRIAARAAAHLKNPMVPDEDIATIVTETVTILRTGVPLEESPDLIGPGEAASGCVC